MSPAARHTCAVLMALTGLATAPASAQTEAEAAARNMQLAAGLCLKWLRQTPTLQSELTAAGFAMSPGMDPGSFEASAFGVGVQAGPGEGGHCKVESDYVPLTLARAIADAVVARGYTGTVGQGGPGDRIDAPPTPCTGITLWDTRPVKTIEFIAAGNSGECLMDGTSAIYMR